MCCCQQGKARLGAIVHQKNAAALCLTAVKNEDQREFAKLVDSFKSQFNEGSRVQVRMLRSLAAGRVGVVPGPTGKGVRCVHVHQVGVWFRSTKAVRCCCLD